jgi:hypothetical protein
MKNEKKILHVRSIMAITVDNGVIIVSGVIHQ